MPLGKIESYDLGSKQWPAYVRRVNQFMLLNGIKAELKVATLITLVGEPTYNLMCDLCSPNHPETKTFDQLVTIVGDHLEPQRSVIAERHVFRLRRQNLGEPLSEYLQSLKHLSTTCSFGSALEENLRDQFVSGLASEDMRSRLFAEKDIQYKRAVELALALEAAEKHASASAVGAHGGRYGAGAGAGTGTAGLGGRSNQEAGEGLHAVRSAAPGAAWAGARAGARPPPPGAGRAATECWRCGKPHSADKCRFKQYNCDQCQRRGHLKKMCKSSMSNRSSDRRHNFMDDETSDSDMYNIQVMSNGDKPYFVDVRIGNKILTCEIDTGSKISAINEDCYREMFSEYPLHKDDIKLCSYSGSSIEPIGYIIVCATIDKTVNNGLQLYVIKNGSRPLLGRCWMRQFNINQLCINNIDATNDGRERFIGELKDDFPQVFTDKLGKCKTSIRLQLTHNEPVFVRARPVPLALRVPVERELNRLEAEGSIYPIEHSDFGTPIVPVVKASGEIRLCGDYKTTVNPILKREYYPLPRIDELFAALSGGEEYSKIDLTRAYMQCPLDEDSQALTAISTHLGTFAFRRTPYGLSCIPEKFQKLMEETLRGLKHTVVFLDDICVTGVDRESHMRHLRAVIERLAEVGLTVKLEKCKFLQKQVSYLGFIIDKDGLRPDASKVEAINKAPRPTNVTQLKAFLGLINYYGKFVPNLSSLLHPMYELLKKESKWRWSDQCEKAFVDIKSILSSDKVLTHYDPSLPLVLSVDSSSYGIGAVLAHKYKDGSERPISCASRTLSDAEKNYSQLDKEALAIFYGVQKHHQFLYARQFILKTDHKPLSYIFGPKGGIPQTAASRLQRWAANLAAYDFKVEFVTSKHNGNADALSRLPLVSKEERRVGVTHTGGHSYLLYLNESLPVTYQQIADETKKDVLLSRIVGYIMFGWPNECRDEDEKPFYVRRTEMYIEHGCILYKYRIVIPPKLQKQVLGDIHDGHLGMIKMKSISRNYVYWPSLDKDIEDVCRSCEACRSVRDAPPRAALHPWEFPATPWQRLHADFAQFNGKYYIVVIDAHSKWLEAQQIRSTSAYDTITYLRQLFAHWGMPFQLVTDNGPPFQSSEFKEFCRNNLIKHTTSSPYRPQGNGAAENAVKMVKKALKRALHEGQDIHMGLSRFLMQYRNCEHATTRVAPAVAMLGRRLRTRLDGLRPQTAEIVTQSQAKQIDNSGGVDREFRVGDTVLTRDYSVRRDKWSEGQIVMKTGPVSYKVSLNSGGECRRHTDQILPVRLSRFSMTNTGDSSLNKDIVGGGPRTTTSSQSEDKLSDYEDAVGLEDNSKSEVVTSPPANVPTRVQAPEPAQEENTLSERAKRAMIRNERNKKELGITK